jgi:hypothetical protein
VYLVEETLVVVHQRVSGQELMIDQLAVLAEVDETVEVVVQAEQVDTVVLEFVRPVLKLLLLLVEGCEV